MPVAPLDTLIDIRNTISSILGDVGISVECHHHEVATAGQCEIDFKFSNLLHTADNLMLFKYVVKNTAHAAGQDGDVYAESRSTATTVRACIATSRFGRTASRSLAATSTRGCRKWQNSISAGCSSTLRRSSDLRPRRRTATNGSCRALRHR